MSPGEPLSQRPRRCRLPPLLYCCLPPARADGHEGDRAGDRDRAPRRRPADRGARRKHGGARRGRRAALRVRRGRGGRVGTARGSRYAGGRLHDQARRRTGADAARARRDALRRRARREPCGGAPPRRGRRCARDRAARDGRRALRPRALARRGDAPRDEHRRCARGGVRHEGPRVALHGAARPRPSQRGVHERRGACVRHARHELTRLGGRHGRGRGRRPARAHGRARRQGASPRFRAPACDEADDESRLRRRPLWRPFAEAQAEEESRDRTHPCVSRCTGARRKALASR